MQIPRLHHPASPFLKSILGLSIWMLLGPCHPTQASWQVIDNFETTEANNLYVWNFRDDGYWGTSYILIPDSAETENDVFYQDPMHYAFQMAFMCTKWALPGIGVTEGSTATLYFRWYQQGPNHTVFIGLSPIPVDTTSDDLRPTAGEMDISEFGPQVGWIHGHSSAPDSLPFVVRNGDNSFDTNTLVPDETWLDIWIVIHNREEDGVTVFDESELYYAESGGSPQQISFRDQSEDVHTSFRFRTPTTESLIALMIWNSNATGPGWVIKPPDIWYLDNLQIDYEGANLTIPPNSIIPPIPEEWIQFPVDPNGWTDTGDWLGWLNIRHRPWIYSLRLDRFLYTPDAHITTSGAWTYIPQPNTDD